MTKPNVKNTYSYHVATDIDYRIYNELREVANSRDIRIGELLHEIITSYLNNTKREADIEKLADKICRLSSIPEEYF
jgi:hypothetical protein